MNEKDAEMARLCQLGMEKLFKMRKAISEEVVGLPNNASYLLCSMDSLREIADELSQYILAKRKAFTGNL